MGFFLGAVRQFVIMCKCQQIPDKIAAIKREEWYTQMLTMWIISQQPGEYNPMHIHTQCTISTVMYLKVPKMLPSRKGHRSKDDGSILFFGNASRDIDLSVPQLVCEPEVGDFYILYFWSTSTACSLSFSLCRRTKRNRTQKYFI